MKKYFTLTLVVLLLITSGIMSNAKEVEKSPQEKIIYTPPAKMSYEMKDLLKQAPESPVIIHKDGSYTIMPEADYHGLYLEPEDCLWMPQKTIHAGAVSITITAEASSFEGVWLKTDPPTDDSRWGMLEWERINSGMYRNQNGASEELRGTYRFGIRNTRSVPTEVYSLAVEILK